MRSLPGMVVIALSMPVLAGAGVPTSDELLPPLPPWQSHSHDLMASPDDQWITPAERSGLSATPRYRETVQYLERLVAAAPQLEMIEIGRSSQGRAIWMVIASADGAATPAALRANAKPTVLVQAGIHSGEIDGKDAGLMLLRDMSVARERRDLLDKANLLFVPILNVDGHERFSSFGRINQRGPVEMGWRSNRRNLNLNRDYTKMETPGIRAIVDAINTWQPQLYVDVHVTDGVDYQYDVTFGFNGMHAWSPAIAGWLERRLESAAVRDLTARGHVPGPLIFAENYRDYHDGISYWTASPRYSNGYGDARHLPTVLVENHSLKPYMQRVLGTYVFLESVLRAVGEHGTGLRDAIEADRARRRDDIVLSWREVPAPVTESLMLAGIASHREYSGISGSNIVRWTGDPVEVSIAVRASDKPGHQVRRPARYYIPAVWSDIATRLERHGIRVERVGSTAKPVRVQRYRLPAAAPAARSNPFEGCLRIEPGEPLVEEHQLVLQPGDSIVETDQALGTLAVLLLEPQSPDSLLQWGYFLEIMNRTEYFEDYVAEPLAQAMLADDPELARRFRERLASDDEFAADPKARLRWFYEQSPYHDDEYRLYPIARSLD